jgi:hypothetical protein
VTDVINNTQDGILLAASHCFNEYNDPEDEILYGTAGYLYTLNLVKYELDLMLAERRLTLQ